ncbi:MAG TPA: FAD-dependent oxidoreductase [Acidobacteriota bacterium]|nr:FAD-dependent oxidoreductase [Acidobacteriota bacterium]
MRVLIIGGVAAGPKAAAKIIRLMPDADVSIIEKDRFFSYAGCGLPYYISGKIKEQRELMETPAGVMRDAAYFKSVKNLHVYSSMEALEIYRDRKQVRAKDLVTGVESLLPYDKLVLATGASPVIPPIPGIDRRNVFTLHGVHSAEEIKSVLPGRKVNDVVVIGGGLIGVEATEALAAHGCRITIVEMLPQILGMLDWEMARLVENYMESKGVRIMTGTKALGLEGLGTEGSVERVRTDKGDIPAGMVIMAIGVRPNVGLARQCGLDIGKTTGAIRVDDHMRTSDPDIYAAGDCVECVDRITGHPCYVPLGSTANKQGRVAAVNICGGNEVFPGIIGSSICKIFDYCAGRTGLTEKAAIGAGYDVIAAMVPGADRAHYMPESRTLLVKMVADKATGKLLGVQVSGPGDGAKRIDVAATAITAGMTLDDIACLDISYAPPYASAMDNLITAANVARNKRDGYMVGISAGEIRKKLEANEDFCLLDVRSPDEYAAARLPKSTLIPLGELRGRLAEVPRDKEIVTYCAISLRGYEAACILRGAGFKDVKVLDGGMAMWPFAKEIPY